MASDERRVGELRLVVPAGDSNAALHFYRDVLGLREQECHTANGGHVTILEAGRATVEIIDPPYVEYIDEVEVGRRVAGHIRVAFEVEDTRVATGDLVEAGAVGRAANGHPVGHAELAPREPGRVAADPLRPSG